MPYETSTRRVRTDGSYFENSVDLPDVNQHIQDWEPFAVAMTNQIPTSRYLVSSSGSAERSNEQ
jgi:hypothetical protein